VADYLQSTHPTAPLNERLTDQEIVTALTEHWTFPPYEAFVYHSKILEIYEYLTILHCSQRVFPATPDPAALLRPQGTLLGVLDQVRQGLPPANNGIADAIRTYTAGTVAGGPATLSRPEFALAWRMGIIVRTLIHQLKSSHHNPLTLARYAGLRCPVGFPTPADPHAVPLRPDETISELEPFIERLKLNMPHADFTLDNASRPLLLQSLRFCSAFAPFFGTRDEYGCVIKKEGFGLCVSRVLAGLSVVSGSHVIAEMDKQPAGPTWDGHVVFAEKEAHGHDENVAAERAAFLSVVGLQQCRLELAIEKFLSLFATGPCTLESLASGIRKPGQWIDLNEERRSELVRCQVSHLAWEWRWIWYDCVHDAAHKAALLRAWRVDNSLATNGEIRDKILGPKWFGLWRGSGKLLADEAHKWFQRNDWFFWSREMEAVPTAVPDKAKRYWLSRSQKTPVAVEA
jgi:hypothetical protein